MTKLLEQAIEMLERMPADAQDGIARALLEMDRVLELDDIEPEHRAAVAEGMVQASRGDLAARQRQRHRGGCLSAPSSVKLKLTLLAEADIDEIAA